MNDFKAMIRAGGFLVLDTETTGIDGEIVQIAIVDDAGAVVLDSLVKPSRSIPPGARAVHGITDDMVATAPAWRDLHEQVAAIIAGRDLVIYNAVFDRKMMHRSDESNRLERRAWRDLARWWCAMEAFAARYGEWNTWHQSYRWQKLTTAARFYDLPVIDAHSARGDALMTLAVCKAMAAEADEVAE